jgi:hypothetical protein
MMTHGAPHPAPHERAREVSGAGRVPPSLRDAASVRKGARRSDGAVFAQQCAPELKKSRGDTPVAARNCRMKCD